MQVNVRQQRTYAATLHGTQLAECLFTILQNPRLEPLLDQAHNTPIRYAMLDESYQPFVPEGVEKCTNVCIKNPVHFPCTDPHAQGIQSVVWIASRAKSIGKSLEIDLVDRI